MLNAYGPARNVQAAQARGNRSNGPKATETSWLAGDLRESKVMKTEKKVVTTEKAPRPVGPYSQALVVGRFVFVSGQAALDPSTGELVGGGVAAQTERVLENISAILEAAGTRLERVIKTNVFLVDMNDFAAMNEVYGRFFQTEQPARTTVAVARLPLDAVVEIEAVAVLAR